jgi:hypothetical protein
MASNLSAIITANGDSNASVWAFRQLLALGSTAAPLNVQYGTVLGGSGGSGGPITVTLPIAYSTSTSYVVHITMRDSPAAQVYAAPVTATTFQFGWQNGGGGAQYFSWTTIGT